MKIVRFTLSTGGVVCCLYALRSHEDVEYDDDNDYTLLLLKYFIIMQLDMMMVCIYVLS